MITVKVEKTSGLMRVNGYNLRYDKVVFNDMFEAMNFIKGQPALDWLDESVILGPNYKVIEMVVSRDKSE